MSDKVIQSLQAGQLAALVDLSLDHVLSMPINKLVSAELLSNQVSMALQQAVSGDQTQVWATEIVHDILKLAPEGPLKSNVDLGIIDPVQSLVGKPVSINLELVQRLMSHEAIEDIFRAVLIDVLESFSKRLRSLTSGTPKGVTRGFGALRGIRDKALSATPIAAFAQQIEGQLEKRVSEHVDRSIAGIIDLAAQRMAHPSSQSSQADLRNHVVNELLNTDMNIYQDLIGELGVSSIIEAIATSIRTFVSRTDFRDALKSAVAQGYELIGDKTPFDILDESGMGDQWRSEVQAQMVEIGLDLIETKPFKDWLNKTLN